MWRKYEVNMLKLEDVGVDAEFDAEADICLWRS